MNKDKVVATYREIKEIDEYYYDLTSQKDAYLPIGFLNINDWIDGRQIAKHRAAIQRLMRELGMTSRHDFIGMARCLSLTDTFWMKREDEDLSWCDVSLYRNPFNDVIARIAFDGTGMYGRQNSPTSPEFATSGTFEKCWIREDDQISLLKRGSRGFANSGQEPYSEKLASDLLSAANVKHASYSLLKYHKQLACKCPLFTSEDVGFVSANRFFRSTFGVQDMLSMCEKCDSEERFIEMIVFDCIIANSDRHSGNYGFLVENETGNIIELAPLFDHNMACLPYMTQQDRVEDCLGQIGPKIGTDFVDIAKALITQDIKSKLITLRDFDYEDPGFNYPKWKLDALNYLKDIQIRAILA